MQDFLGKGMKFPPQIDPLTGLFKMVSGDEDIKEAIYIILNTSKGERKNQLDFGCDLLSYIYEVGDLTMMNLLKLEIVGALKKWEPRIKNIEVNLSTHELSEGKIVISLEYVVRATNRRDNLVFPYYLEGQVKDV